MKKIVSLVLLLTLVLSVSVFAETQDFQVKTKVKPGAGVTQSEWPAEGQGVGDKTEGYMFSFKHSETNSPSGSANIVFEAGVTLPPELSPDVAGEYYLHAFYTGKEEPNKAHNVKITSGPFKYAVDENQTNDITVTRTSNTSNSSITVENGADDLSIKTTFNGGSKVVGSHVGTYKLTWGNKATLPVGNYAAVVTITVTSVL